MESLSFQHYLETQSLISYEEASKRLAELGGEGGPITLTHEDYLLGIFDMVGELMRFAITNMATSGKLPSGQENLKSRHSDEADKMEIDNSSDAPIRTILTDLQALRIQLESFEAGHGGNFSRDVSKKMDVMRECVEKVEKSSYGLIVRGRERPKGWVPDIGAERPRGNDFDGD
jgi:predicted translin family RNA/ssDNA-binding protein